MTFSIFLTSYGLPCLDWNGWDTLSHCCHCTTSSRGASFMTVSGQAGHLSHLLIMHSSLVLSKTKWSTNVPEYEGKLSISLLRHPQSIFTFGTGKGKTCRGMAVSSKTFFGVKEQNLLNPIGTWGSNSETIQKSLSVTAFSASFKV